MYAESRNSAVGKDVEPKMRDSSLAVDFDLVRRIPFQLRLDEQRFPLCFCPAQPLRRRGAVDARHVDARPLGIVAGEVRCIDHHSAHDSRRAEPDDCPVVTGCATTACFPAVHPLAALGILAFAPFGRGWLEKRFLRGEELVVCRQDSSAESLRS